MSMQHIVFGSPKDVTNSGDDSRSFLFPFTQEEQLDWMFSNRRSACQFGREQVFDRASVKKQFPISSKKQMLSRNGKAVPCK